MTEGINQMEKTMKVKLLKRWLRYPQTRPGQVIEMSKAAAEEGIGRGLCAAANDSLPADPPETPPAAGPEQEKKLDGKGKK